MRKEIALGEALFQFQSFDDWVNHATARFRQHGVHDFDVIGLDKGDRICRNGKHYAVARDEDQFPITIYRVREK